MVVYSLVQHFMYMIGMGAAIFTGEYDIAQVMLKTGFGVVGLLIIVFSTVTTTFLEHIPQEFQVFPFLQKLRRNGQRLLLP